MGRIEKLRNRIHAEIMETHKVRAERTEAMTHLRRDFYGQLEPGRPKRRELNALARQQDVDYSRIQMLSDIRDDLNDIMENGD